jgi:hypothetical protein
MCALINQQRHQSAALKMPDHPANPIPRNSLPPTAEMAAMYAHVSACYLTGDTIRQHRRRVNRRRPNTS